MAPPCRSVGCLFSAVLLSASSIGLAQAPAELQLTDLTVPATRLPEGCTLPPNYPIDQRGMTRLPGGAANPWSPTESRDQVTIHRRLVDFPRVPDGPPPMPRDARRFSGGVTPNIASAYAAVYAGPGEPDIRVWAVKYGSAPPPAAEQRRAFRVREFLLSGKVIALLDAADRGPCFDAVRSHLRSVMTR